MASASHAAHDSHKTGEVHPLVGHLVPCSTLFATGAALIVLTAITVAVRYMDLGEANIYIAIGIAVVKATLVSLFFMHLRWDRPFNLMMLVGSMIFVLLMMVFCLMDVGQNLSKENMGNPSAVQNYLNANAPFAPITAKQ